MGGDLAYEYANFEYFGLRALFNLLFFIIVNTLLMNIVFGIIVDTFSELRDEKFQTEDQMKNYCFICSLRSFDFQKAGTRWEKRVGRGMEAWRGRGGDGEGKGSARDYRWADDLDR